VAGSTALDKILGSIAEIESDSRYMAPAALVQVNAPLALIQVEMKARLRAMKELENDVREADALLREVFDVLTARGGDFQLGPKGKHRDLADRIGALVGRR